MRSAALGITLSVALAATLGGCSAKEAEATAAAAAAALPEHADNFLLVDQNRVAHELYYYRYAPAIVLMTQANGSKTSEVAAPALEAVRDAYADKGVVFFMVNSKIGDDRDAVAAEAERLGVTLPILIDEHQLVGGQLGATRDGEVFVLDTKTWKIAYHGPIDDRFQKAAPKASAKPRETFLADALDQILAGGAVTEARIAVAGSAIDFPDRARKAEFANISYSEEVAPIIIEKCATCHLPGGIGPFPMNSYEIVKGFAPMMRETIRTDRMPPYFADPHIGKFKNDAALTPDQLKTLVHWIEAGAPRGDGPDPLAEKVKPAPEWPESLGQPDFVVEIPPFTVPATGVIPYENPVVQNPFKEDKWLRAVAIKPGERAVLHHVTSGHVRDGDIASELPGGSVGSYTPGAEPQVMPEGTGAPIPAGGAFAFSMHYTTAGKVMTDATKVGFYFHDEPPMYIKRSAVISDGGLTIPAGAQRHEEVAYLTFPADAILYTIYPHAHYRGSRAELSIQYPDGREEILLSLPKYDFNWQRDYDLVEPLTIPAGSKMIAHWTYDNSVHNPANPDPTIEVTWGEQSHEEMMYLRLNYRWVDETRDTIRNDLQSQLMRSRMIGSLDDNRNDKVEIHELRGRMAAFAPQFATFDKNGDGGLDVEELAAAGIERRFIRREQEQAADTPDL